MFDRIRMKDIKLNSIAWIVSVVLLLITQSGWASQNYVKANVDRDTLNLGDRLVYTVEVMTAGEKSFSPDVILPPFADSFQVGDVFTRSSVSILNGRTYIVNFKEVHLIVKKTGDISIGPARVELIDPNTNQSSLETTNSIMLLVKSAKGKVAKATPTPEIDVLRPIKKSAKITLTQWLPFGIVGFLIMLIFGIMAYLKYRPEPKEKVEEEPVDPRTPIERAFDDLEEAQRLKAEGKINEYYSQLSLVLRRYLAQTFEIKAEETTTREMMTEMEKHHFKTEFMDKYKDYATESDKIKYANILPSPEELEEVFPRVKQLITDENKVDPPPPPPEPEESEEGENEGAAGSSPGEVEGEQAETSTSGESQESSGSKEKV